MAVRGDEGVEHESWREGGTKDEVDCGAAILSLLCSVGIPMVTSAYVVLGIG